MHLIAHRGYSDLHKDNTMEAFNAAIENNFDIIELDIQLTKDNRIIIYHDININDKFVRNMNLDEIQKFDSDIMTLEYFFSNININKINVYLDVKGSDFICVYLHNILKNIKRNDKILIGSFNLKLLERLYQQDDTYNLGIITENVLPEEIYKHYIATINIAFVSFHWTVLDNKTLRYLHMKNVLAYSYTCKNDNIKKFIMEYDIDGIVSNYKF
jgi:glycerophosphoryl diester phosphodiesterase